MCGVQISGSSVVRVNRVPTMVPSIIHFIATQYIQYYGKRLTFPTILRPTSTPDLQGGVTWGRVDPATFGSRDVPGLFFAGENVTFLVPEISHCRPPLLVLVTPARMFGRSLCLTLKQHSSFPVPHIEAAFDSHNTHATCTLPSRWPTNPQGELLDVDGVTGGHNFQACWTAGAIGGAAAADAAARLGLRAAHDEPAAHQRFEK